MDWKKFLKLTKIKVLFVIITFVLVFFINIPALFEPCNWLRVCPDFIRTSIISVYPNFYEPAGNVCGIACFYRESSWNISMMIFDLFIWIILNISIFALSHRLKNK